MLLLMLHEVLLPLLLLLLGTPTQSVSHSQPHLLPAKLCKVCILNLP
jgi:hypothetical protein